jgi:hypothetical protein
MFKVFFKRAHYVKVRICGKEDNPQYKFKSSLILPRSIKENIALTLNTFLTDGCSK